jgi:hypothetical protein
VAWANTSLCRLWALSHTLAVVRVTPRATPASVMVKPNGSMHSRSTTVPRMRWVLHRHLNVPPALINTVHIQGVSFGTAPAARGVIQSLLSEQLGRINVQRSASGNPGGQYAEKSHGEQHSCQPQGWADCSTRCKCSKEKSVSKGGVTILACRCTRQKAGRRCECPG